MSFLRNLESLKAELEQVRRLAKELDKTNPIGALGMNLRADNIESEIRNLENKVTNLAKTIITFDGSPTIGSNGISLHFASNALKNLSEIVDKEVSSLRAGPAKTRGPLPKVDHNQFMITSVAHGSFGFVFEEDSRDGDELFESSLKISIDNFADRLDRLADEEENLFVDEITEMDDRLISSYKNLLETLHKNNSWFKMQTQSKQLIFDKIKTDLAFSRISNFEQMDETNLFKGTLLGILPIDRRFEFQADGIKEIIKGDVGQNLASSFLQRIKDEDRLVMKRCEAKIQSKVKNFPNGSSRTKHTLIDIEPETER